MNSAFGQSLIDLLLASGVPTHEEAVELSSNLNGGSWTTQVLDSGKVDENRFLSAIGNLFQVPVVAIDAKTIDRQTLGILPSRFVFQHHILPIELKENAIVLATYDLFNSVGAAARLAVAEEAGGMGARAARANPARDEDALRRGRGDVRRNSEDEPRFRSGPGHRDRARI